MANTYMSDYYATISGYFIIISSLHVKSMK